MKSNRPEFVISGIFLIAVAFTIYSPYPLINSDSVHGFEAMNGWFWTGKWNTRLVYNAETHQLAEKFLTWWSPGQYMVPMFFIKLLHLKLGTALVLVNFLSVFLGTVGYYFVFKRYKFDTTTIWLSILLILFSGAVLTGYWEYDGGENLNYLLFPWIIVWQRLFVTRIWKFIFPGLILLIAFFCKLQMLIVVPPLIFLLIFTEDAELNQSFLKRRFQFPSTALLLRKYLPLFVSLLPVVLLVYFGFVVSGDTPAHSVKGLTVSAENSFFPIASPFFTMYVFDALHYFFFYKSAIFYSCYLIVVSGLVILSWVVVIRGYNERTDSEKKYIFLVIILSVLSAVVFVFLYTKGTPIDMNPRHMKLTSFLLYPIVIQFALRKWNERLVLTCIAALAVLGFLNHIRLVSRWTKHSQVTLAGFRLSQKDMPLSVKARLDSIIHEKTIVVSRYESRYSVNNYFILPVQSQVDLPEKLKTPKIPVFFVDSLGKISR